MSSNLSQSECVVQKSDRNAAFKVPGRPARGSVRIASASRVSARPTLNPLSRSVRANPASLCRIGLPTFSPRWLPAAVIGSPSRDLAEEAIAHLTGELRAILVRLEQA